MKEDSLIEIGSEFHMMEAEAGRGLVFPGDDYALTFCGRTAIETVLKNLSSAKSALLPSYCCDSMIEPFRRAGIKVSFYSVYYQNGMRIELGDMSDIDILLWCNYFGFRSSMPDMTAFLDKGGVVIEDITHSFFSDVAYNTQSTYLVASLRKWEPILCGGICASKKGLLRNKPKKLPDKSFLSEKALAMSLKSDYLEVPEDIKKPQYLSLFAESNTWLEKNYSSLKMDPYSEKYLSSVDAQRQKEIRRNNARILYEGLCGNTEIIPLFDFSMMDCPLFVPVIVKEGRNEIRQKLIENKIYCPIHWPRPKDPCNSNLYDIELSLICDQRYSERDMAKLVSVLCKKA